MKIKLSSNLMSFAKLVSKKAEMFVVGGFVRNYLLGTSVSDIDLASKLTLNELEILTKDTKFKIKEKNKMLGTAEISCENEIWDYATFRKEKYSIEGGHSPIKVSFINDLREDAKRRDFTINAIYYNILKDQIIDVYSGLYDLKKHRIRTVETPEYVFQNDGLRILRMVRQACELNFKIHREAYLKAKQMVYRLKSISGARKESELMKILQSSSKPFAKHNSFLRGLKLFNLLGIWQSVFSGATKINYKIVKKTKPENRFVGLLIDLINTVNPDCISYYLENILGKDGLCLSKTMQKEIIYVVSGYFDALNGLCNKMFFFNYYQHFEKIGEILQKKSIFKFGKYNFYYKYINKFKIPIQIKDLKISGQELREIFPKLPERKYSSVLFELFNLVFDGKVKNEKETLIEEVKKIVTD